MMLVKRLRGPAVFLLDAAGAAAVVAGCWIVAPALGLVVGGVLALGLAFMLDASARPKS